MHQSVLIVGAGLGLSASLARRFAKEGAKVSMASRSIDKLRPVLEQAGGKAFVCDAADPQSVNRLFDQVSAVSGEPDVVIYNASGRTRGPFTELDPAAVAQNLSISAFGGFLVSQAAAKRMLPKGNGVILLTGASASIKGFAQSAPFAMGKFALRGLAQSMARELAPKGIHVAHIIIDGGIRAPGQNPDLDRPDSLLEPDAIADTYWQLAQQPRSAWSWEIEVRPWVEKF